MAQPGPPEVKAHRAQRKAYKQKCVALALAVDKFCRIRFCGWEDRILYRNLRLTFLYDLDFLPEHRQI